jgi:CheY-like chemotaxis protein
LSHSQNGFAFSGFSSQPPVMTQPLAMVFYERLMPGSQLVNRLQDLNYRVLALNNLALLAATAKRETPLLLLIDLAARGEVCAAIEKIKAEPATSHLPVIAFAPDDQPELLSAAQKSGANFTIGESGLAGHLPQLLDQALNLD